MDAETVAGFWFTRALIWMKFSMSSSAGGLISLGAEVLLGSRKKERLKYDWVAMLLCFVIVCAALVMFALAWTMLYHPGWVHL